MAHTHEDVLLAVHEVLPDTKDVAQVYSDDDTQWWVEDAEHNTFAFAWYDAQDELQTRDYHP
jgi:hypothetical protein